MIKPCLIFLRAIYLVGGWVCGGGGGGGGGERG